MNKKWVIAAPWTPSKTSVSLRCQKIFFSSVLDFGLNRLTSNPSCSLTRIIPFRFKNLRVPFLTMIVSFNKGCLFVLSADQTFTIQTCEFINHHLSWWFHMGSITSIYITEIVAMPPTRRPKRLNHGASQCSINEALASANLRLSVWHAICRGILHKNLKNPYIIVNTDDFTWIQSHQSITLSWSKTLAHRGCYIFTEGAFRSLNLEWQSCWYIFYLQDLIKWLNHEVNPEGYYVSTETPEHRSTYNIELKQCATTHRPVVVSEISARPQRLNYKIHQC